MAVPTEKSPGIEKFLEAMFGRTTAITDSVCVACSEPVSMDSLRDDLSRREYRISGLCQRCQDGVFGS